jgi:hypothetical protein
MRNIQTGNVMESRSKYLLMNEWVQKSNFKTVEKCKNSFCDIEILSLCVSCKFCERRGSECRMIF